VAYGLPPKRYLFVLEFLKDLNGTKAARRAQYTHPHAQGCRLLSNVKVQQAIQAEFDKRAKRLQIDADTVLREIARLAFSDIRKLLDEQNRLRKISSLDDDTAATIAGVEFDELGNIKRVRHWDKTANLNLLARHLKLLTDKLEVEETSKVEIVDRTRQANERVNRIRRQSQQGGSDASS
jgi:phage terminase small subunit